MVDGFVVFLMQRCGYVVRTKQRIAQWNLKNRESQPGRNGRAGRDASASQFGEGLTDGDPSCLG